MAVIVVISGICLEKIPANALFSCTKGCSINGTDSIYKDLSVYRTESLSQREVLNSMRIAGRDARRSQVRITAAVLFLSIADILPRNFQSTRSVGEGRLCYEIMCSLAILTYIHNQDGEKA